MERYAWGVVYIYIGVCKPFTYSKCVYTQLHPILRKTNLHNITHSLISQNLREWMFVIQLSLLIVTFLSIIPQFFSLRQTIKEVNPHLRIAPCVNMWSVFFFFFFCHLLNVMPLVECWCMHMPHCLGWPSGVDHTTGFERSMNSNSIVSHATLNL